MNIPKHCPVCFIEKMNEEDSNIHFITLECNHTLCEHCYIKWHIDQSNSTCVICRKSVTSSNLIESYRNSRNNEIESENSENSVYSILSNDVFIYYVLISIFLLFFFIAFVMFFFVEKETIYSMIVIISGSFAILTFGSIIDRVVTWYFRI